MILLLGYGFIGKSIYNALKEIGMQVKVISRTIPQNNADFIYADINAIKSFSKEFIGVTTVIHCLHTTVPANSNNDEVYDIQSNLIPFVSILDLCEKNGISNFIFISSGGAIYGNQKDPSISIKEDASTNPISSYGITKLTCEKYLLLHKNQFNGKVVALRPSNIYGIEQRISKPNGIVGHAINACKNNLMLTVWGDGEGYKDYLHINDFVNAIVSVIRTNSKLDNSIYNVSSNERLTINQIIRKIERRFNKKIKTEYQKKKDFDIENITLNSDLFRETFKWNSAQSFDNFLNQYE